MDLRVELGRRPALLGGPAARARGRCASSGRSWPTSTGCSGALRDAATRPHARRDLVGRRRAGAASRPRSSGWRQRGRRGRRAGRRAARRLRRRAVDSIGCPCPSILAAGAVHTALTDAGLRGRTDIVVDAADILDVHAMAMVLAVGADGRPSAPGHRAGRRAGRDARRRDADAGDGDRQPRRRLRGRPAQDARPDGHQRGRVVHRRRAVRRRRARRGGRRALLPDRGRLAGPDDLRRPRRAAAPTRDGGPRRCRPAAPAASRGCPTRLRPLPRRRRGAPLRAVDRQAVHPGRSRHDGRRPTTSTPRLGALPRGARPRRRPTAPSRATSCASVARRRRVPLDEVEAARSIVRRFVVVGDERRRAVARGAPGADDRHPARRRRGEHRRGRRGPGLVRARDRTASAATRGSSRSPRPGSA